MRYVDDCSDDDEYEYYYEEEYEEVQCPVCGEYYIRNGIDFCSYYCEQRYLDSIWYDEEW